MNVKQKKPEVRTLSVRVPPDLLKRLKLHAVESERTIEEIVAAAIERELKR